MSAPHLHCLLAVTVLMLVTLPLPASTMLPPGGTVSPLEGATVPDNIASFIIQEVENPFFLAPSAGAPFLSGHIDEAVLLDPFGLTCPTCLDFAFQITVDPASSFSVYQAVLTNFTGFTVNVGYAIDTGSIVPGSMGRGPAGGGIGVLFGTDTAATLGPDENSVFFLIATDAKSYNSSGVVGINGSDGGACNPFDINHCRGGQVTGFLAPTSTPEPSSALLLGLGLAGIAAFRKKLLG